MKKISVLFLSTVVLFSSTALAKTYRVQTDISFKDESGAEAYLDYVQTLQDKVYEPTVEERVGREDLWTTNRMSLIWDYDDEGLNRPGEAKGSIDVMGDYEKAKADFKKAKEAEVIARIAEESNSGANWTDIGGIL